MNLLGFLTGWAFGFVIVSARLHEDSVVRDMLLLRDFEPYLVLGSAVLVAVPLLRVLRARHWRAPLSGETVAFRPQSIGRHHLLGALVFGTGWAVAATCPVPALGMLATGNLLGLPVIIGLLGGIVLRDQIVQRSSNTARRVVHTIRA